MTDFRIPIQVAEIDGLARDRYALRIGVPLAKGALHDPTAISVRDANGRTLAHQALPLALWSDRSIKWLLLDAITPVPARARTSVFVLPAAEAVAVGTAASERCAISWMQDPAGFDIDTGAAHFRLTMDAAAPLKSVRVAGRELLAQPGSGIRLRMDGAALAPLTTGVAVEESGPLRLVVAYEGGFGGPRRRTELQFHARCTFLAGSALVRLELQIRNPRAARHVGGTWDLGDPGSIRFDDLSVDLYPQSSMTALRWYAQSPADARENGSEEWVLHQASSGGEHWNCANHVDASGAVRLPFKGYRVRNGATLEAQGLRATPCVQASGPEGWVAATVEDFWQNFPKALRFARGVLGVGVFPAESQHPFELQGGERKRHGILLDFGAPRTETSIPQMQRPVLSWVDPDSVERSRVIAHLIAVQSDADAEYLRYIGNVVDGPHAFLRKREAIDEYGWRNFGDLYADHEAVNHRGPAPFISHYNNQYDFIGSALVHYLRSGDVRWRQLAEEAARHTIDIDIYHTDTDRPAFNGGLFWHTDHYRPAATSTHRTYSRQNGAGADYGGGPSNEHDYSTGLLYYYFLSGDRYARECVLRLAEWVIAMDDGCRTIRSVLNSRPTGYASKTVDAAFHGPGRGAGNSINTLLDAYALTRDQRYMRKLEELIRRCIHPADDIDALGLSEPEHRWSYLVFLQVLGRFLDVKVEAGEFDYWFHYARESLLHYAGWIARCEVPYRDILHKVELPTESWPAHDSRKSHVLHVAAKYAPEFARAGLRERAAFFRKRCLEDLLSFETAFLTRPLVILCGSGYVHGYYTKYPDVAAMPAGHGHFFGEPTVFLPQRAALAVDLRDRARLLSVELARMMSEAVHRIGRRIAAIRPRRDKPVEGS